MPLSRSAIIIMGASGDLASRKLIPAIIELFESQEIQKDCIVIGTGRSEFTNEEFRAHLKVDQNYRDNFFYYQGVEKLSQRVKDLGDFTDIVIFMALPPRAYGPSAEALYKEGFRDHVRLIIEKPFGSDLKSAQKLNHRLHKFYKEEQIYRIDHYLAKEAVQNMLIFRFANNIFYPVWSGSQIESIQINAFEEIGVESRGAYFDQAGIIRDMVQNHLFQMMALLTMEAPISLDAEDIRAQKMAVLKSMTIEKCFSYQYEGYTEEPTINHPSHTETYAEMKLYLNTFRWEGVPIYIRTGKAVGVKHTSIIVTMKKVPPLLFNRDNTLEQNRVAFLIQPQSGIIIDHNTKTPGSGMNIGLTNLDFCYSSAFDQKNPLAYRKLLLDALKGDQTLFVSAEETELSWKKIAPFLDQKNPEIYKQGGIPKGQLDAPWVDITRYAGSCRI